MELSSGQLAGLLEAIAGHPLLRGARWRPLDLHAANLLPVVERLLHPYPSLQDRSSQILIALEEARGNIARHARNLGGGASFVHHSTPERATLEFLFADAGAGFAIDGALPPYPSEMVGREYEFRHALDGVVRCQVVDANTIEILFRKHPDDTQPVSLEDLPEGGLGLSIMSKVMDRVLYLSHVGTVNLLWMQVRNLQRPGE